MNEGKLNGSLLSSSEAGSVITSASSLDRNTAIFAHASSTVEDLLLDVDDGFVVRSSDATAAAVIDGTAQAPSAREEPLSISLLIVQ